jgi:hypothetical protein
LSPEEIIFEANLDVDNLCGGEDQATICCSADGGSGNLTLVASHAQGLNLSPDAGGCFGPLSCYGGDGQYTIEVTDGNGCQKDTTIEVSCPVPLSYSASSTEVSCTGYSDATLTASISGGTTAVHHQHHRSER